MAHRWQYQNSAGTPVAAPAGLTQPVFEDRDEAETWLGEAWADLLDAGVDQVVLLDGDDEVYGPMSLHPPA
ncbi:MAG TPA: hypothetical protein VGD67_20865 [Pseudonocardiaceae bacterium]